MVQSGLVGWWPLNEWNGRANDLSGNDNHGTLNGGPTQGVAGLGGLTSYSFDGSDDYIRISENPNLKFGPGDVFTITAWVRVTSGLVGGRRVFQHDPDTTSYPAVPYYLGVGSDGSDFTARGRISDGDTRENVIVPFGSGIPLGQWGHFAFVVSESSLEIYLNGELGDSANRTIDPFEKNADFSINENSNQWPGKVEDVRVYNRALSIGEIQYLYEMGTGDYTDHRLHDPFTDLPESNYVRQIGWSEGGDVGTGFSRIGFANDGRTVTNTDTIGFN